MSTTKDKIIAIYPEGSSPPKEEVIELYVKLSTSQKRQKKSSGDKSGAFRNLRQTRRNRGRSLYKSMIKSGFWS